MTIDEAIEFSKYKARQQYDELQEYEFDAEEHEQLAEWLEELKTLRYCKDKWNENQYQQGRVDAIDDCIDKFADILSNINEMCGRNCPVDCNWGTTITCKDMCKKWLTEQLKDKGVEEC